MRNKIDSAKTFVKENKVGIAVIGTVTIVYCSIATAAYFNFKSIETQFEIAKLNSPS